MNAKDVSDILKRVIDANSADDVLKIITEVWESGRKSGEGWAEIAIGNWLDQAANEVYKENEEMRVALLGIASDVKKKKWRRPEFRSIVDEVERKS